MLSLEIVKYAYLATLICVIIVEAFPGSRLARPSALAAIFLVTVGGGAWSYAAYYTPGVWPEYAYEKQAKAGGQSSRHAGRSASSGGDEEPSGDAAEGDEGEEPAAGAGGGADTSSSSSVASAGDAIGRTTQSAARSIAQALGLAGEPDPKPAAGDSVSDCADCPEMVIVPSGTARIGADEDDLQATPAERPSRIVRVWPGFAISRAVTAPGVYSQFLRENRRAASLCRAEVAEVIGQGNTLLERPLCISAHDAQAFAVWLSNRTGKTYRLPSATEWEYAMRVLPVGRLTSGEAKEFVADCWQDHLPRAGFEIMSAQGSAIECETRMLKGAAIGDDRRWHRVSARRPISAGAAISDASFRLVRDLDR